VLTIRSWGGRLRAAAVTVKSVRVKPVAMVLACGSIGGVVVAAMAFPAVALVGLTAKSASDSYADLPSVLSTPPTPQATYVYANDGKTLITTFYEQNRRDVTLADIAPVMQRAIVAAEDTRFFEHGAVDAKSVLRALVSNSRGGHTQGASTLTMQYVRNVLENDPNLTEKQRQDASADTVARKLQEMRYATTLEHQLPKEEILERYLNIAYFGDRAYGILAASWTYFSKPPSQLTLAEAALLAGLVQSPDSDNPATGDRAAALARRTYVLDAMARSGTATPAEVAAAKAEPLALHPTEQPNDCVDVPSAHNDWGFFCDYLRQWWEEQPQFGATDADRERALKQGGYTIVTSLDPRIQAAALGQSLAVYGYGSQRALPIAVVRPGTGRVAAMAVNRHYSVAPNPGGATHPNTVNQLVAGGGSVDGYQAGSTFKLFTMLAALEAGYPLTSTFDAPPQLVTEWPAKGPHACDGKWCPANANPSWMDGPRTMWTGYGRSVNTYFVWLEQQVGVQNAVAMAQRLGITFRADGDAALAAHPFSWGAFTLGVADTTPLDLASAYATVASGGTYCAPLPVLSITDRSGAPVPAAHPNCRPVISPDLAAAAADAARCPVGQQSAYGGCDGGTAPEVSTILGGRPVAGKTGSSEENATETFVGFTPQCVAAGIAADPDDPHDHVGAEVAVKVDAAVAGTLAAAVHGLPYQDFPVPSTQVAFGRQ
jgi:membrane peptidoglycan carboxypeptidase